MSVAPRYTEWTDDELMTEERRLKELYPVVHLPLSTEVDADMTRLLEVQFALFERNGGGLFMPYYPPVIHRQANVDDLQKP